MHTNTPSIFRRAILALTTASLCFVFMGYVGDAVAAYTLSRGRQVLIDRGLQVQSLYYSSGLDFSTDRWQSSNYNTINLWEWSNPGLLAGLGAETPFARQYDTVFPGTKYLTAGELPYASNLVAYQYGDEMGTDVFNVLDDVKNTFAEWRNRYGNVLAYVNFQSWQLNPAQIALYMNGTQPDMLMMDRYPDYSGDNVWSDRLVWYERMQKWRLPALAGYTVNGVNSGPLPYAQFLNLYRKEAGGPLPDESFVRLQQNASWAFGYTYVTGFIYNDVPGNAYSALFSTSDDSQPTPVFNYAAEANRQSLNLGPALVRLVSNDIRMIGGTDHNSRPSSIAAWQAGAGDDAYLTGITPWNMASNQADPDYFDILVGYLQPLLADNAGCTFADESHFMIVNGATGDAAAALAQTYRLTFDFSGSTFDSLVRLSRETGRVEAVPLVHDGLSLYHLDFTLEGGTGDLFRYWDSSTPLPTIPEPDAWILLFTGFAGLLAYAWHKRKGKHEAAVCK